MNETNDDGSTVENRVARTGKTGTGKTTPLTHLFWKSDGFLYCDPNGGLNEMLELTDERQDEMIWIDDPEDVNRDDE